MTNLAPKAPGPREGMPGVRLDQATFTQRFLAQYIDAAFDGMQPELQKIAGAAWEAYDHSRKSPRTEKAGPGYADPNYDLAVDWIRARQAVEAAQSRHADTSLPPRILIVNASSRSEHTCPGEMSKSFRLADLARGEIETAGIEADFLNLSDIAAEYGRNIHPCKACFSTAAPLCHWPCSCYPNYSLGQTQDWMNEIYPLWAGAHGVFIVSPVNWYQVSSPLKLMMDRLVCADRGNADPTGTQGKKAALAKQLELDGWDYPQHLKDRLFSVVVHGDVEGAENVRRSLSDWLKFMGMFPAGPQSELDRYIGYWEPYATNHDALDRDAAVQAEVRNAARSLAAGVLAQRAGTLVIPGAGIERARKK